MTRFFNKAHKGLYFIPIFAFLFIALLFISYFVKEEPGGKNPLHGWSPSNMHGAPGAAGIYLIVLPLIAIILILLLAVSLGKKYSRIAGAFLHMIFSLICVILGAVQGNNDGIKKFVLITAIIMFFDDCDCFRFLKDKIGDTHINLNYSNLSKNDNKPNKSDIKTPAPLTAELNTVGIIDDDNDGNTEGNLVLNPIPE